MAAKAAMDEEAALQGFHTFRKENPGFPGSTGNKRSFPGFEELETPVKRRHTKKMPFSFDESKFDAYFEWCKQHEQANKELLAKEKQEDRMVDERRWRAEFELRQEEMRIHHIEAEALRALALNGNKDKEQ